MFNILSAEINVLQAINEIDLLLERLEIAPVLNYNTITYILERNNDPFMHIRLSAQSIAYVKNDQAKPDELSHLAFIQIERLIITLAACKPKIFES